MHKIYALIMALVVLSGGPLVFANPTIPVEGRPHVNVQLESDKLAESLCFTAQSLRNHVNAQLGYNAFTPDDDGRYPVNITVHVSNENQWAATITVERVDAPVRRRELSTSECHDLLDVVVFSLTLVLDPMRMTSGESNSAAEQARALVSGARRDGVHQSRVAWFSSRIHHAQEQGVREEERVFAQRTEERRARETKKEEPVDEVVSAPVAEDKSDIVRQFTAGAGARIGLLPSRHLGVGLGVRRVWDSLSLGLAFDGAVPNRYPSFNGDLTMSTYQLELVGCGGHQSSSHLYACAHVAGGVFRGRGREVDDAQSSHGGLFGVGLSLHPTLVINERMQVHLDAAAYGQLNRVNWVVGGRSVASSDRFSFALGASFSTRLPFLEKKE